MQGEEKNQNVHWKIKICELTLHLKWVKHDVSSEQMRKFNLLLNDNSIIMS